MKIKTGVSRGRQVNYDDYNVIRYALYNGKKTTIFADIIVLEKYYNILVRIVNTRTHARTPKGGSFGALGKPFRHRVFNQLPLYYNKTQ